MISVISWYFIAFTMLIVLMKLTSLIIDYLDDILDFFGLGSWGDKLEARLVKKYRKEYLRGLK